MYELASSVPKSDHFALPLSTFEGHPEATKMDHIEE